MNKQDLDENIYKIYIQKTLKYYSETKRNQINGSYVVFFAKNTQYHKKIISSLKSIYKFNTLPIKIPMGFSFQPGKHRQVHPKVYIGNK